MLKRYVFSLLYPHTKNTYGTGTTLKQEFTFTPKKWAYKIHSKSSYFEGTVEMISKQVQ